MVGGEACKRCTCYNFLGDGEVWESHAYANQLESGLQEEALVLRTPGFFYHLMPPHCPNQSNFQPICDLFVSLLPVIRAKSSTEERRNGQATSWQLFKQSPTACGPCVVADAAW